MSLGIIKTKLASTLNKHKSGESASSQLVRNWMVRDSHPYLNKHIVTGTFSGLILLAVMAVTILLSGNNASASSITVSIDDSAIDLNVAPTTTTGVFSKSNDSTISVTTDNGTGYTLGIRADGTNPDKLINGSDPSVEGMTLTSITSTTTEATFKALDSTAYNGMWGYLPSRLCTGNSGSSCTSNTDFLPAPTTTGDVLDITSTANSSVANTYTLALGARVDNTQKLGSYSNTYVIYANANAVPYSIVYDDNVVSNMPEDVNSDEAVGGSVTFSDKTPTRAGYKFLGWCTVSTPDPASSTNDCATAGGTYYAAGATTAISSATSFHLYAMWKNIIYMQDLTSSTITTLLPNTGSTARVLDARDDQEYTIAKLADGKYWMVENLNLAGGTKLTSDDTDIESDYILPTEYGFGDNNTLPYSPPVYPKYNDYTGAYLYNSGSSEQDDCANKLLCYSYYTWSAATLGSESLINNNETRAPFSICPKKWKLPTANYDSENSDEWGDFYALAVAYGWDSEVKYKYNGFWYENLGPNTVPNFIVAGKMSSYSGTLANVGGFGFYWSGDRRITDNRAAFQLSFSTNSVSSPVTTNWRNDMSSVRCVFSGQ